MSFWSDLTGDTAADAARAAAADTYGKQQKATAALRDYGDQYANEFRTLAGNYAPYTTAGTSALQRLMGGLGLGSPDSQAAFTDAYRATPGYANGLETGGRAITGNAAARGMLNSGATLKALQRYGSDYEDKRAGDYLTRLMGLSSTGLGATRASNSTVGQGLQGQLGTRTTAYVGDMNAAGTIGQGDIAAANAQAAGSQNLLNTGLKIAGMVAGGMGGMGGFGGMGGASGASLGVPIGATRIAGPGDPGFRGWA